MVIETSQPNIVLVAKTVYLGGISQIFLATKTSLNVWILFMLSFECGSYL